MIWFKYLIIIKLKKFSAYAIKLGTLENISTAKDEWVLRSYTNTAKKKHYLSKKGDSDDEI